MTDSQYLAFEVAFREAALPRLQALRALLLDNGAADLSEIEGIDHDVSRGLGFVSQGNPHRFVELMLEDGGEHGFEGVSVVMNCSISLSGQIWAPFNFTEEVGISDPSGIEQRMALLEVSSVADAIRAEWDRSEQQVVAERAR